MLDERFEYLVKIALSPEIDDNELGPLNLTERKNATMNYKSRSMKKITVLAAALCLIVGGSAFAVATGSVTALITGFHNSSYSDFCDLGKAEQKAGFTVSAVKQFDCGYSFDSAEVQDWNGVDDENNTQMSFNELYLNYVNNSGNKLTVNCMQSQFRVGDPSELPSPVRVQTINGTEVTYRVYHYKFVPKDYQLTENDYINLQRPDYEISYGSDDIEETDIAVAEWNWNDIDYSIMDIGLNAEPDDLFSMAQELTSQ